MADPSKLMSISSASGIEPALIWRRELFLLSAYFLEFDFAADDRYAEGAAIGS